MEVAASQQCVLPVVRLIHENGVGGLGGFDGCVCTHFSVLGVSVDVSCRKGSNMDIFPDFHGIGVRVTSGNLDATRDVLEATAKEVVRQLADEGYDIMVRYCTLDQDNNCECSYCGKPREQSDYLCAECKTKPGAFGVGTVAEEYAYSYDGLVHKANHD